MPNMRVEQDLLTGFKMNAAIKGAPGASLQDTLGVKTCDELKKLAKGYSKLDKHSLIEAVGKALLDSSRYVAVFQTRRRD